MYAGWPSDLMTTRSLSSPYCSVRSQSAPSFSYVLPISVSRATARSTAPEACRSSSWK